MQNTTVTITTPNDRIILGAGEYYPHLTLRVDSDSAQLVAGEYHNCQRAQVSIEVHNGRTLEFGQDSHSIYIDRPSVLICDNDAIEALAEWLTPLVARLQAGWTRVVDRFGDERNDFSDDAQDAYDQIQTIIDRVIWWQDEATIWDSGDWIYDWMHNSSGITHETSDDELSALARESVDAARADAVVFSDCDPQNYFCAIYTHLAQHRENLRDDWDAENDD